MITNGLNHELDVYDTLSECAEVAAKRFKKNKWTWAPRGKHKTKFIPNKEEIIEVLRSLFEDGVEEASTGRLTVIRKTLYCVYKE